MRQPWWEWGLWMYRASIAQANGAGGAIVMDVVPLQGTTMIVMSALGENDGASNGIQIVRSDEDGNEIMFTSIASAGQTKTGIPQSVPSSTTSAVRVDSTPMETRVFRANDRLTIQQTGAGAQNDTLVIQIRAFLSSADRPIVSKGRSTNPGDVTIATPTVDMIR